jgi:putative aldouronate transport system permease protein
MQKAKAGTMSHYLKRMIQNKYVYVFVIISLAWYLLFCYGPMYGLSLAFKDYNARLGITGSHFVGLKHYLYLFGEVEFWTAFGNTIAISAGRILFEFPVPILLALLLNEIRSARYRKVLQTAYTFPHFLSWVVVASVAINILGNDGLINTTLSHMGLESHSFLSDKGAFRAILFLSDIWKESGWTAIIFLAAITAVPPELYEASIIDGANRFQKALHVTLPCIRSTIVVMLLLAIGGIMNAGFDQIFNMYNPTVQKVSDIIDTYIYRITFQTSGDFGFSTAVGLFKSLVNFVLLFGFDRLAKRLGEAGLF